MKNDFAARSRSEVINAWQHGRAQLRQGDSRACGVHINPYATQRIPELRNVHTPLSE